MMRGEKKSKEENGSRSRGRRKRGKEGITQTLCKTVEGGAKKEELLVLNSNELVNQALKHFFSQLEPLL
jgi:hypothetical protein